MRVNREEMANFLVFSPLGTLNSEPPIVNPERWSNFRAILHHLFPSRKPGSRPAASDSGSFGSGEGEFPGNRRVICRGLALKMIDAMEPCICFIDEVEKAQSGVSSSGDSGVSARLFRYVPHVAQRPPERRVHDLHLQRYFQAAAGVFPCRAVRRLLLPRPAQQRTAAKDLRDLPAAFRSGCRPGQAQGRPVDGCRNPCLLPSGGVAGRAVGGCCPERRPRGCHGC